MIYGYARCSTNEKKQDVERQKRELRQAGASEKNIFFEYESGAKTERKQLALLLDALKPGDTLVTTEVSRLTRSTRQLCEIIETAKDKRLELVIGSFRVDCRNGLDPMTDGMLKMMGVFAEMERNITSARVKSGMDNAKAKGIKLGRPRTAPGNLPAAFYRHLPKYRAKEITQAEFARLCNVSRQCIHKYLKLL